MRSVLDTLDGQASLDKIGDKLQKLLTAGFDTFGPNARRLQNMLHGTWLGHPLHPVLTDLAIGGWTAAVTLDLVDQLTGDETVARGADAALGLGLLGALGSAVTGATDWQHTEGRPRRLGVVHALLNVIATTLFTLSFIARLSGRRGTGRWLASVGITVGTAAAYVGGDLVFGEQIGVNHAGGQSVPNDFTVALHESELHEDEPRLAEVAGTRVVLVRHAGRIHALGEVCSHLGGPLAEGRIENSGIVCPWHFSRFRLEDGGVLDGPATFPEPCFETRVQDGQIEIRNRLGR